MILVIETDYETGWERLHKIGSNMEPPEVVIRSNWNGSNLTIYQFDLIQWKNGQTKSIPLRIRGSGPGGNGDPHEPLDKYATTIPKLTQQNFMWNGMPSSTLMEDIIYPLFMGLGCGKQRSKVLHLKKALYGSKQASRLSQCLMYTGTSGWM